jgi:dTDP-4-amino-4,6-dideoxygalactose transaminase
MDSIRSPQKDHGPRSGQEKMNGRLEKGSKGGRDTKVPLLDLAKQSQQIRQEIDQAIREVLDSHTFILGPVVAAFEREIAPFCGVAHAIGVASGTDALLLALMALGVKAGDRVVTVPYTFFATGACISRLGARPVYIDIDPHTYNLDPNRLEDFLRRIRRRSDRPKVVIPVHLFGQMADMKSILEIASRFELRVVEDAAQALGAKQIIPSNPRRGSPPKAWRAGSLGDLGCFSFYPSKNLGAFGDAGMVTTQNKALAEKVRMLRVHGARHRYDHSFIGMNSRLDAIQAAILRVKLKYLDFWTDRRRRNAERYEALFKEFRLEPGFLRPPRIQPGYDHIFNQFVIRTQKRDALRKYLETKKIGTEVYYPVPLHLQACYRSLGYHAGDFPESERAARETVALPIYPELTLGQQRKVVQSIQEFRLLHGRSSGH